MPTCRTCSSSSSGWSSSRRPRIEARRYRELLHALWRAYLVEIGLYVQRLSKVAVDPSWRSLLAADLYRPLPPVRISISLLARMRRTYLVLTYLLFIGWISKVAIHPRLAASMGDFFGRMRLGPLPGWFFAAVVLVLLVTLTVLTLLSPHLGELENWASDSPFCELENALCLDDGQNRGLPPGGMSS